MRSRTTLAAGFLAGFWAGQLFLLLTALRGAGDFLATLPTTSFAVWVVVRSIALYGLLFALAGLILAGLCDLAERILRRDLPTYALVSGVLTAAVAFAYLTVWWQIDVLAGLPLNAGARRSAVLWQAVLAAAIGLVDAALVHWLRARRRPQRVFQTATIVALIATLLLTASGFGLGLGAAERARWRPERVVLVGLDGLTFRVLSPLLRRGELPTFQRLVDDGAWGSLLTYGVAASPVVWTTVATGKKARDHGITDFVTSRAGYRARTVKSTDRRVPALWNILSHGGRSVGVVNWLVTTPPEAVEGAMVSGLALGRRVQATPAELQPEIAAMLEQQGGSRTDQVFEVAEHLVQERPSEFLALYDRASDNAGHQTWKYYRPGDFDPQLWQIAPEATADHGSRIPDTYALLDRRLGELLDRVGDDSLVIVVSDHGQLAARRPRVRFRMDRLLAALDFAELVPAAENREERPDYSKSRAYTLVETKFAPRHKVNLNLVGREPEGIVPASEASELIDELIGRLRAVRLENGAPLFGRVAAGGRGGQADITVDPSRYTRDLRFLDRAVIAGERRLILADLTDLDTEISGDHDHQGVIFVHGAGVRPGPIGQRVLTTPFQEILHRLTDRVDALDPWLPVLGRLGLIERATTLDIAPTVLHALGEAVARDMAGRPLVELLDPDAEVRWVDSYDDLGDAPEPVSPADDTAPDDAVLDQLKTLGYVN